MVTGNVLISSATVLAGQKEYGGPLSMIQTPNTEMALLVVFEHGKCSHWVVIVDCYGRCFEGPVIYVVASCYDP